MIAFRQIEDQAALRHGGIEHLRSMIQYPKSAAELQAIPDARWLSEVSKLVFQVGFNWEQMERKWPVFEEVFKGFGVPACAHLSDEQLEAAMATGKLVKHWAKMKAIQLNAAFFLELIQQHGSLGNYFSQPFQHDFGAQLLFLQKHGNRLGGKTGAYWLRRMGVDSLIMTPSVERTLQEFGVVDKAPSSAKAWAALQPTLDAWLQETGESLNYLGQIMARASGDIYPLEDNNT